jgi:hypothetical protein
MRMIEKLCRSVVVRSLSVVAVACCGLAPQGCGGRTERGKDATTDSSDHEEPASPFDAGSDASIASTEGAAPEATAAIDSGDSGPDTADGMPDAGDGMPDAADVPGAAPDAADAGLDSAIAAIASCAALSPTGDILFDIGHDQSILTLRRAGDRILSEDEVGHWILWDSTQRSQILSGDAGTIPEGTDSLSLAAPATIGGADITPSDVPGVDMAAGTVAIAASTSIAVLSATDGHALGTVSVSAPDLPGVFGLATDGSYVWVASPSGLTAWSTSGTMLVRRPGDYSNARIFAAPTELRVGASPAADVEIVSMATGASTVVVPSGALSSPFASWFLDGARFLTVEAYGGSGARTNVTIYSAAGVQENQVVLSLEAQIVVGQGNYYWAMGFGRVQVFAVEGDSTPVWSDPSTDSDVVASIGAGSTLVFSTGTNLVEIVDLSGATVTRRIVTLPPGEVVEMFDSDSAGNWAISGNTVIFDGASAFGPGGPRPLNCGHITSIAGTDTGRVAIATEADQLLYVDLQSTNRAIVGAYALLATQAAISGDGTVLATSDGSGSSVNVFSLPGGANLDAFVFPDALSDFSLSRGGTTLGRVGSTFVAAGLTYTHRLLDVATGAASFTDTYAGLGPGGAGGSPSIALSPSGALAATSAFPVMPRSSAATTNVVSGGRVVQSLAGYPVGFVDDTHLVVKSYSAPDFGDPVYAGSFLCDLASGSIVPLALPELEKFVSIGTTRIYAAETNSIYNLSDGAVAWSAPGAPQVVGDVAGGYVVFARDHGVVVQSY